MKLKQIGSNQTELDFGAGKVVFFSYETPVAAYLPGLGYVKTTTKYSRTTNKHVNQWLGNVAYQEVDQIFINALVQ